jgi:hypothetical protein
MATMNSSLESEPLQDREPEGAREGEGGEGRDEEDVTREVRRKKGRYVER